MVCLDYDNPLVDSWPQDFRPSNAVFEYFGHPPMDALELAQEPYTPAVTAIASRTGVVYDTVKRVYDAIYTEIHEELAPPVPSALDLLQFLKEQGIFPIALSNKEQNLLDVTFDRIRWKDYFSLVRGAIPGRPHKPDPQVIT